MYHYVRPEPAGLPHFTYLHADDFALQLDWFARTSRYLTREDLDGVLAGGAVPAGAILPTFDDGLSDHYEVAAPELERRGAFGIFYVATGPYQDGRLLPVHRVHMLMGLLGGTALLMEVRRLAERRDLVDPRHRAAFANLPYRLQDADEAARQAKTLLNYHIRAEARREVLDNLMAQHFDEAELCGRFYMSSQQIAELQRRGHIIGSHSVSHPVMSTLDEASQKAEITQSFDFLDAVTGGLALRTYCHPYGTFQSFNRTTEQLLDLAGCRFSLNVEPRDVLESDWSGRPQALPRYDCNRFPHGRARSGR